MPALKTVRDGDGGKGSPKILILKFFEHYSKGRRGAGGGQPHVKKSRRIRNGLTNALVKA